MSARIIPAGPLPKSVVDYFERISKPEPDELTPEQKRVADEFKPVLRGLSGRQLIDIFVRNRRQEHPLARVITFAKEGESW